MATEYNPDPATQRTMAEQRLASLRHEHYNNVLHKVVLEGQQGNETELRNIDTRLTNIKRGIDNLTALLAQLPAEPITEEVL